MNHYVLSGWFSTHLPGFISTLNAEVERVDVAGLKVVSPYEVDDASLESDGIHLTSVAGLRFLDALSDFIQRELSADTAPVTDDDAPVVHLGDEEDSGSEPEITSQEPVITSDSDRLKSILQIVKGNTSLLNSVRPLTDSVSQLSRRTDALEGQARVRRMQDNLVFARIKEDSDVELNRSREDRVVISGLPRTLDGTTTHAEKKEHYKAVVDKLVTACPDLDPIPVIQDIMVSFRRDLVSPVVEVRFQSASCATSFRKAAAALAKAKDPDFGHLFFSNSVTQATRVRIEILRAIAKKLTTESEAAYVQGFTSRPILHYVVKESMPSNCAGTGRGYSFSDAVGRYGDLLCQADLASAYRRAGSTFQGAMEHYFVVLKEGVATAANQVPLGQRGRPARGGGNQRGGRRGSILLRAESRKRPPGFSSETPSKKRPGLG